MHVFKNNYVTDTISHLPITERSVSDDVIALDIEEKTELVCDGHTCDGRRFLSYRRARTR